MSDIYLISPPQPKPEHTILSYGPASPPLGLAYLAAPLLNNNFTVKAFEMDSRALNVSVLEDSLKRDKPKIAGITSLTNTYITALTIAKIIKNASPETITVMGGQHVTFCYEDTLNYDFVDFVIIGEGEESFYELCNSIINQSQYSKIRGIAYKENNSIVHSLPERLKDINDLDFPARNVFNLKEYIDPINIISSRGCPAKCIFCSASAFRDTRVRFRSADNVLEEIDFYYKQNFDIMNFMDDNFMLKKQRVVDICSGIQSRFPDLLWTCSARADNVCKELIKLMASSGCKGLHFGLETASQESQKSIGKYLSLEKLEVALKLAHKHGIRTFCSMIIGLPDEDSRQIKENVKYAIDLNNRYNTSFIFGILTPFPGTKVYNNAKEYGIKILSDNYSDYNIFTPVLSTKYFTPEQLKSELFDAQKAFLTSTSEETMNQILSLP